MAFTMHSHSGEFCPGHAKDNLEDIVNRAIRLGFKTVGLTEHMPRLALTDLYPEELDDPQASLAALPPRHEAYLSAASALRARLAPQVTVLVGFESEWLGASRAAEYAPYVSRLAADPRVDFFVGSVHHVDGHPIDFDAAMYAAAVADVGAGDERALWAAYYDRQRDMLLALSPRVVGHFDLIRLLSSDPGRDPRQWPDVWERVVRNLEIVRSYGGWLECNSSALRKGLAEPYPARPIAEAWIAIGGRFTLSDDSHSIAQVATNYVRTLDFLEGLGVEILWSLGRTTAPAIEGCGDVPAKASLVDVEIPLSAVRESLKLDQV